MTTQNNEVEIDSQSKKKKPYHPLATAVLSPLIIWAIVHAIQTRTLADFVRYSLYIAVPLFAILAVVVLVTVIKSDNKKEELKTFAPMLITVIALPLVGAMYYAFGASIKDAYLWTRSPNASGSIAIIATIIISLGLGIGLFFFRLRMRSFYGVTEVIVGLFIAGNKIASIDIASEINHSAFYVAILTAGVFLIVRGLDSVQQGLTKAPFDKIALKVLVFLKIDVPKLAQIIS